MNINQQIAVMQAFSRGERIECRKLGREWAVCQNPQWDWMYFEYRVAPSKPAVIQYKRYLHRRTNSVLHVCTVHRGEPIPAGFVRWIDQVWQEYQP